MAITRCPYCHAIIDENDKYCNNCGTQLLFPEDENADEEIPGEKIIDAETEDKDYEIYEPAEEQADFLGEAGVEEDKIHTEEFIEDLEEALEEEDEDLESADLAGLEDYQELTLLDEEDGRETEAEEKTGADEASSEEAPAVPAEEEPEGIPSEELMEAEPPSPAAAEDVREAESAAQDETWSYPVRPIAEETEKEEGEAEEPVTEPEREAVPESREEELEEPAHDEQAPGPGTAAEGIEGFSMDIEEEEIVPGEPVEPPPPEQAEEGTGELEDRGAVPPVQGEDEEEPLEVEPEPEREDERRELESLTEPPPPPATEERQPEAQTFDTGELERMGRTVDLGKEKVDKFIEVMAEKEREEVAEEEAGPLPSAETRPDTGGTLPPWADKMKGAPSFDETKDQTWEQASKWAADSYRKETEAGTGEKDEHPIEDQEEGILPRSRPSDSGIGFPERLTQAALPFEEDTAELETAEQESEEEPEEEPEREEAEDKGAAPAAPGLEKEDFLRPRETEPEGPRLEAVERKKSPRGPINLSVFLKAKSFDCLFVAFLWLICVWFAARAMGTTPFGLLSSSGGLLVALYLTFLLMYVFLFQFFLGETLGDRLFRKRD